MFRNQEVIATQPRRSVLPVSQILVEEPFSFAHKTRLLTLNL